QIANVKDYILIYVKNKNKSKFNRLPLSKSAISEYKYEDENGKFRIDKIADKTGYYSYKVTTNTGRKLCCKWLYPRSSFLRMLKNNEIYWSKSEYPYKKVYFHKDFGQVPTDLWDLHGTNQ